MTNKNHQNYLHDRIFKCAFWCSFGSGTFFTKNTDCWVRDRTDTGTRRQISSIVSSCGLHPDLPPDFGLGPGFVRLIQAGHRIQLDCFNQAIINKCPATETMPLHYCSGNVNIVCVCVTKCTILSVELTDRLNYLWRCSRKLDGFNKE